MIGILAEYFGMIHGEVKGRPNLIVAELITNKKIDDL